MRRRMQEMMEGMTAAMQEAGPMAVCRTMMASAGAQEDGAACATPELRALFEEWVRNVEDEVLAVLRARGPLDLADLAAALKVSPESTLHVLRKLVREGSATLSGTRASAAA